MYLITRVKFILSSISNGWLFWFVNYTSAAWNSELNVFKGIEFVGGIFNKLQNDFKKIVPNKCIQNS